MEDCEILEAIENVKQWLNCDDTWDNDLDGYDRIDCCEATLRKLSQQIAEIKNRQEKPVKKPWSLETPEFKAPDKDISQLLAEESNGSKKRTAEGIMNKVWTEFFGQEK